MSRGERGAFTLVELPVVSRGERGAFTLVELLVVVAILALLISMVAPSLGRTRDLARKAVCSSQLHAYGVANAAYIAEYNSYPPMGTNWSYGGWPKMHGILAMMGGGKISLQVSELGGQFDDTWALLWDKAMCPAMDLEALWEHIEEAILRGQGITMKPGRYPLALGYQWNQALRAAGGPTPWFPSGRWPTSSYTPADGFDNYGWSNYDNTFQIDYPTYLPADPNTFYITQATHPREVENPSACAEAWDGIDPPCAQGISWTTWALERFAPGWHVGPPCWGTNGWALLNGIRHPGSPNILYADAAVHADATRRIRVPRDIPNFPAGTLPDGVWNSWDDYDPTFGTVWHVLPKKKIIHERP